MLPFFSVYLDLLRIIACAAVYIGHNGLPWLLGINRFEDYYSIGHDAVVVFFVLSGYVVAYAAHSIEKTPKNYIINRVARILPPAIAAILVSYFLMRMAYIFFPEAYTQPQQLKMPWHYALSSLVFINQNWWNEFVPFSNSPYWSLSYEVWYYALFFCLNFIKGTKRIGFFLLILLASGPKIAILAPAWFLGTAAYFWRDRWTLNKFWASFLFVLSLVIYAVLKVSGIQITQYSAAYHYIGQPVEEFMHHGLGGAAAFAWDYVLAFLIAMHLYAARFLSSLRFLETSFLSKTIKKIAGYTYSAYIFHMPLNRFFAAVMNGAQSIHDIDTYRIALQIGVLPTIIVLANMTEHQKKPVRVFLLWLTTRFTAWGTPARLWFKLRG